MAREVDTRDFSYSLANDARLHALNNFAEEASGALPGAHNVNVKRLNSMSGTPAQLESVDAPASDEHVIARALRHVTELSSVLGFAEAEVPEFSPDPWVDRTSSGVQVVHLRQNYHGIPVFQMARSVHFAKTGEIRGVSGDSLSFAEDVETNPSILVKDAVEIATRFIAADDPGAEPDGWGQATSPARLDLGGFEAEILAAFQLPNRPTVLAAGPFGDFIKAELVIFNQGPGARLGWRIQITLPSYLGQYEVIVGADEASRGEILYCTSTANNIAARGLVFTHNPGEDGSRTGTDFPRPRADYPPTVRSPQGGAVPPVDWVEADATEGNATRATLGETGPVLRGKDSGGTIVFDPLSDSDDDQKVLNIFYFCSYMHDFFYGLGFDEASGNFQRVNFTGAPGATDAVSARSHSGPVFGTANMLTRADGDGPIMNMGLVASVNRHTAMDSDVVFHEFVHGVSNRLVGGRLNTDALRQPQSRGMGEGWSDYYALSVQNFWRESEKVVTGDWVTSTTTGIRGHAYDDSFPDGFGAVGTGRYTGPHAIGEIWCAALMHATRRMVEELESKEQAYSLCWQVVLDGFMLTAANPSFLDARDAILTALDDLRMDAAISSAVHSRARGVLWKSFARFGMGANASCPGPQLSGIRDDSSLPADL